MKKLLLILLSVLMLAFFAAGCSNNTAAMDTTANGSPADTTATSPDPNKTTLRIGTEPVAHLLAEAGVQALEDMGYTVEIVMFDDYFTPNVSLAEGSIDANFYQHQPFLDTYNKEKGTNIVMLAPLYQYYGGIYSEKYDSLDALKASGGGLFKVAQDASNQSLDLKALQKAGLITLTSETKALYGIADIVDNPYNFKFVAMDKDVAYKSIDEFAAYIGTSNTMAEFGLDPTANRLYYIGHESEALGVCVNAENTDTQWAKDLVTAYSSDSAKAYVKENTKGANIPVE